MPLSPLRLILVLLIAFFLASAGFTEKLKPWEERGLSLAGSPYGGAAETRYSTDNLPDGTLLIRWTSTWPEEAGFPQLVAPELTALAPLELWPEVSSPSLLAGTLGGQYSTSFLYFQELEAVSELIETAGDLPWPPLARGPANYGWKGVTLPSSTPPRRNLPVSVGLLFLTDKPLAQKADRANWLLGCLASLYKEVDARPARADDWNKLQERVADWLVTSGGLVEAGAGAVLPDRLDLLAEGPFRLATCLEVALPYVELERKEKDRPEVVGQLLASLPAFYRPVPGTLLPELEDTPTVVLEDYLLTLALVADLAQAGYEPARTFLLPSTSYAQTLARKAQLSFKETLVLSDASLLGKPSEDRLLDYAYVTLAAYGLYGDEALLQEARKALITHTSLTPAPLSAALGFAACGRLWRLSNETRYMEQGLSLLTGLLGSLWWAESSWGNAASLPTRLALLEPAASGLASTEHQYLAARFIATGLEAFGRSLPEEANRLAVAFISHSSGLVRYAWPEQRCRAAMAPNPSLVRPERTNDPLSPLPCADLPLAWTRPGLLGQLYGTAGAAATFARLSNIYGKGDARPQSPRLLLQPRALSVPAGGYASLMAWSQSSSLPVDFELPAGFSLQYIPAEEGATELLVQADPSLVPGFYFGAALLQSGQPERLGLTLEVAPYLKGEGNLAGAGRVWEGDSSTRLVSGARGVAFDVPAGATSALAQCPHVLLPAGGLSEGSLELPQLSEGASLSLVLRLDLNEDGWAREELPVVSGIASTGVHTFPLPALLQGASPLALAAVVLRLEGPAGAHALISDLSLR